MKTKLVKLICDYDFFLLAGNVLGNRQHDVIALSAFPTNTPVVLLGFLVKKILDTDLSMNSSSCISD